MCASVPLPSGELYKDLKGRFVKPKIEIHYNENRSECLGFFTHSLLNLHRKHARVYVLNKGKSNALNVRGILEVTGNPPSIPPTYLHWTHTPYNAPEPDPAEIPKDGFCILDMVFSQPEHGVELTEDSISQTFIGPPEHEILPAPTSGTLPPDLMSAFDLEPERLRRKYSGMYEAMPDGCFIAHNCALLSPKSFLQYYLPPGEYNGTLKFIGDNIDPIENQFTIISPEYWRELGFKFT